MLTALAGEHAEDPRRMFQEHLEAAEHFSVSFGSDNGERIMVFLPDLVMQCAPQPSEDGNDQHLALRIDSIRPQSGHPTDTHLLTVTAKSMQVSATNGTSSDTHRLLDWQRSSAAVASSPILFGTLKLIDRLEGEDRARAQQHRVHYVDTKEYWRCRACRGFWQPGQHQQCPSCGRPFSEQDRRQPEVGKIEFSVPREEKITLQQDMAVLIEPEDGPSIVARVNKVDNRRHRIEVTCRSFEHPGPEGVISPSYNRSHYLAKRSVLASLAARDFGVGLLAQLLVDPKKVCAPAYRPGEGGDWLTNGMIANPPQDRAVSLLSMMKAGEALLIQGPPGTGKTAVIVEAIKRRLATNPDERILVTSHSNLAVDNALERLAGTPGMRAVRVARAERVHPAVDQFRCDDEDDPRLLEANCYFATCATASTSAITDMNFDLVILDEANKARVDEALPALRLGSAIAMVGDHKQLPPVEDDSLYNIVETDPELEDLVNRSFFEQCWEGGVPEDAKCLLTVQHRMHPQIASYISTMSYEGQLLNAPEVTAYDFVTRQPFPVALHFVDTVNTQGGEKRGPGGALRNELEVRVAAHVVRLLDERCPRHLSMAIIAMYAEQVERLRQALGRRNFKRPVKIDTVDSFEGREEDIVVISLVRSNERGRIGFLRVPNRLNVAISRAKRLVACIGDSATLRAGEESMYGVLVDQAREFGGWIDAQDLLPPAHKSRHNRKKKRPAVAAGQDTAEHTPAEGEGQQIEGAGSAATRRRRRRRRRRRGSGTPAGTSPQGETVPSNSSRGPQQGTLPFKDVVKDGNPPLIAGSASEDGHEWHFEPGKRTRSYRPQRSQSKPHSAAPATGEVPSLSAPSTNRERSGEED